MKLPDTLAACSELLVSSSASSLDLVTASLERCEAATSLNPFISVDRPGALAAAKAADARRAAGKAGPLTGIPVAVKDIFCVEGGRTTAGSRMLGEWIAPYDAHLISSLRAAGAVVVAKTNMDEFAMGSSGEHSAFGPTRNPWNPARVPGGSSSGSAAAVAAGLVPGAFGTDTGGSIRQPAAFCGLTGLKPTYGRISRYGIIAFATSLDQAGPLAWTARDAALLLSAVAGFDARDPTSAQRDVPDYAAALDEPLKGRVVGIAPALLTNLPATMQTILEEARRSLEHLGVRFREVALNTAATGDAAYYVIAAAEASTNLARYDGVRFGYRCADPEDLADLYSRSRAEGFGSEVKRRILTGTYVLSAGYYDAYYRTAQRVRRLIRDEFLTAFRDVDAILAPVTATPAFEFGEYARNPVAMYRQDRFTIPASLAGLPALAMPAGMVDKLPVGVQLIGRHFDEATLLGLAAGFQRATTHHLTRPERP